VKRHTKCDGNAFRIEALRRAINHREDYVLRYARCLARIAEANVRDPAEALKVYDPSPQATGAAPSEAAPTCARHIEPG